MALTEAGSPGLAFRRASRLQECWEPGKEELARGSGAQRGKSFLQARPFCEGVREFWGGRGHGWAPRVWGPDRILHQPQAGALEGDRPA